MEYLRLEPGFPLPVIKAGPSYRAIVVVDSPVEPGWQAQVSRWLVDSGCLYMMAWGADCSSWDDAVDTANLEAFNYQEIPEEKFVTTTWHDKEPLKEVFRFAKNTAHHPKIARLRTLVVHISTKDLEKELRNEYESA